MSYRDLEEIISERGVAVDHTTLNPWVTKYASAIADVARRRKGPCDRSWRMDETYIKVKGNWVYLYRAVDKHANTLDFMLSPRRNKPAATKFFAKMLEVNRLPRKIVIAKGGANTVGIKAFNCAAAALGEIEGTHMIRKGGITPGICPFRQFAELSA